MKKRLQKKIHLLRVPALDDEALWKDQTNQMTQIGKVRKWLNYCNHKMNSKNWFKHTRRNFTITGLLVKELVH
jgi:hypothetical protein